MRFEAPGELSKWNSGGLVFTPTALTCQPNGSCAKGALTLEIGLKAGTEESPCLKRIVDVRKADGTEVFYIGQWKSFFIVCSFNPPPNEAKPYCKIGVENLLQEGRTSFVSITSGAGGINIFVDGRQVAQYPGVLLLEENEALDGHRLYFGNAPDLNCPWSDDLFAFALYSRELTASDVAAGWEHRQSDRNALCTRNAAVVCYRFDRRQGEKIEDLSDSHNTLSVPDLLIFDKKALRLPKATDFIHQDTVVNLVGFIPFGFLVSRMLLLMERLSKKTCLIVTIAMGFAISLSIEITQVWLPGRDSSMLDLVANTVGAAIGGAMSGLGVWKA